MNNSKLKFRDKIKGCIQRLLTKKEATQKLKLFTKSKKVINETNSFLNGLDVCFI